MDRLGEVTFWWALWAAAPECWLLSRSVAPHRKPGMNKTHRSPDIYAPDQIFRPFCFPSVFLSVCACLSFFLSALLSVCLSVILFFCLSFRLSVCNFLFIFLCMSFFFMSIRPFFCLSVLPFVCLTVCLPVCLSYLSSWAISEQRLCRSFMAFFREFQQNSRIATYNNNDNENNQRNKNNSNNSKSNAFNDVNNRIITVYNIIKPHIFNIYLSFITAISKQ